MSTLRERMSEALRGNDYERDGFGAFTRWWNHGVENGDTFISFMLKKVTSDEKLEQLWAQFLIERES